MKESKESRFLNFFFPFPFWVQTNEPLIFFSYIFRTIFLTADFVSQVNFIVVSNGVVCLCKPRFLVNIMILVMVDYAAFR